jgi:hypothetical protein
MSLSALFFLRLGIRNIPKTIKMTPVIINPIVRIVLICFVRSSNENQAITPKMIEVIPIKMLRIIKTPNILVCFTALSYLDVVSLLASLSILAFLSISFNRASIDVCVEETTVFPNFIGLIKSLMLKELLSII